MFKVIRAADVSVGVNPEGAYVLSALGYGGVLLSRRYYGYSRAQAMKMFLAEVNR